MNTTRFKSNKVYIGLSLHNVTVVENCFNGTNTTYMYLYNNRQYADNFKTDFIRSVLIITAFLFPIGNFLFLENNMPAVPAY